MKEGDWVAMNCADYSGPNIDKVIDVDSDAVKMLWYKCPYSSCWKMWEVYKGNDRKLEPWVDSVPKTSIVLFGFEMTPTSCLPSM